MTGSRLPYVEGAVLVSGRVALSYWRVLSSPSAKRILDQLADPEEIATRAAIRNAAKRFAQVRATERKNETPDGGSGPSWSLIGTAEAARVLGMSTRRVQQLAAGGLGQKVGGRWQLDADAVADLVEARRDR